MNGGAAVVQILQRDDKQPQLVHLMPLCVTADWLCETGLQNETGNRLVCLEGSIFDFGLFTWC